ncbi:AAA family ATPase [Micromonospora arborensis]|uniref:ATP-binding protein n=1 Tax=Micromonospora arborensis TaxID=2116518 RepID=UPI0033CFC3BD
MNLVGRDAEFATLREVFAECQRHRGSGAVISGQVTIGKTALLHAFSEWAVDSGALVLSATASPSEQDVPYGVLEQLFREIDLHGEGLPRVSRWPFPSSVAGVAVDPPRRFGVGRTNSPDLHELWQILRQQAERRPVVVAIDDVHLADEPSQRALLYLLRRLRSTRLTAIFTERGQPWHVPTPLQGELLRDPTTRRLRLETLSLPEVAELISRQLGDRAARQLAPSVRQLSAGLPSLVHALIEDHGTADREAAAEEAGVGDAFGRAVLSFLYQHDPPVIEVARAAAVLGDRSSSAMLGYLVDLEPASSTQALRALTDSGLLSQGRFRHEAVLKIVKNSITPKARTTLHRRAAELLYEDGAPATAVAKHVITGGPREEPWMVRVLREAATLALAEDDLPSGIRYLWSAYRQCPDEGERLSILATIARAEWRIDPNAVLRFLPELTTASRTGQLAYDDVHAVITYLLWHGRGHDAQQLIEHTCDLRNAVPPSMTRQLGCWFSYFHPGLMVGMPPTDGTQPPDSTRTLSTSVNAQIQKSMPLSAQPMDENAVVIAIAAGVLEHTSLGEHTVLPLLAALAVLMYGERLDEAASWCDSLLTQAEAKQSRTWQALLATTHAMISLRQGELFEAEKHAASALEILPAKSWGIAIGLPLSAAVLTAVARGDRTKAETLLTIPVPDEAFHTPCGLHYLHARGWYYLMAGRPQAALYEFELCGQRMTEWGILFPTFAPWRIGAAQAHIMLGNLETAARFAEAQLALIAPESRRLRGRALRVLAAARGGDLTLLDESARLLESAGDRLELAWTLTDLSEVQERLGESEKAKVLAFRAHVLAEQSGTVVGLGRAAHAVEDDSSDRSVPSDTAVGELSEAQRRVAALAAAGYTNREISRKLHVTTSTVEQHLTQVYRKLRVQRMDLRWVFEGS